MLLVWGEKHPSPITSFKSKPISDEKLGNYKKITQALLFLLTPEILVRRLNL